MGDLIKLPESQAPAFTDTRSMLNLWWSEQTRRPMTSPANIKRVVDRAIDSGWTLEECYKALEITWGFTDPAFEVALRRIKDEEEGKYGKVGARIISLRKERKRRQRND